MSNGKEYKLTWESVSASLHPGYYDWNTERAIAGALEKLDTPEHDGAWHRTEKIHTDLLPALRQRSGLLQLRAEGELIRNVRLYVREPSEWGEVIIPVKDKIIEESPSTES